MSELSDSGGCEVKVRTRKNDDNDDDDVSLMNGFMDGNEMRKGRYYSSRRQS